MEVVLGTKIKGLNMLNQLGSLIWSYKSYVFVSLFYVNTRTKEKLLKVIVKYLKLLPYLKSDGTILPCGSFPFLAVVHRVCGILRLVPWIISL